MYEIYNSNNPQYGGPPPQQGVVNADIASAFYYNPATRFQANFQPQQQQQFSGYGMISSPLMNQQSFGTLGYNPGANPQYGYSNMGYQNPYMQQYTDYTYMQDGYNPSNTSMMFSSEDIDKLNDIMRRQSEEQQEYANKSMNTLGYMGYNYYGNMNTGYNPFIAEKYKREQYQLEQEAAARRISFNKRLSNTAHSYLNDGLSGEDIDNIYDPREVTIPSSDIQNRAQVNRLSTFNVNISEYTKSQYNMANNQITQEYHDSIIGETDGLEDFLNKAGQLYAESLQYDVDRAMRDKSKVYNTNGYTRYLGQQLQNRDGTVPTNLFPNLSQNSTLLEDGTLQIKPPSWMINNKKESEESYNRDKERFIQSIYNPASTTKR